jgi:predicted amidohydrolase
MRVAPSALACLLFLFPASRVPGQERVPLKLDLKDFGTQGTTTTAWTVSSKREEIRPVCYVDVSRYRTSTGSLAISGDGNPAAYGGWARTVKGLSAGRTYRLTAYFHTQLVDDIDRQVVARIDWLDGSGERVGQPDYPYQLSEDGDWERLSLAVPAPPGASAARIELLLAWAPLGTVWWDDITLDEEPAPPDRWVRVGTISLHPRNDPDNLGAFIREIDEIAKQKPDIVCLGEEILVEGGSRPYADVAEPIPGPSTERLGERARRYGMYLVAGLTERDGHTLYNTAVLIDRKGQVAGKYRKVYLPREEVEGGLTPGADCPVFDTDFGKVGLMICWDGEYVDPARLMAVKGAEILFVPAAGGYMTLLKARALENHLYVVTSGYDLESAIIDPTGEVLFATKQSGVCETMRINLAARFTDPWLGDMRARFHKEIRRDLALPDPRKMDR